MKISDQYKATDTCI